MIIPIPFIPRYSFFHHYSPIFLETPFAPIALYHYHFCSSYTHFPLPFHFVRFPSTIHFLFVYFFTFACFSDSPTPALVYHRHNSCSSTFPCSFPSVSPFPFALFPLPLLVYVISFFCTN